MSTFTIEFSDEAMAALMDLTTAINSLASASGVGEGVELTETDDEPAPKAKKAAAKKAAKKAAAKEGPSIEEVRKTLKDYAAIEGKAAAIEILNETGGAASVGELEEDKYQDVIDKSNEGD